MGLQFDRLSGTGPSDSSAPIGRPPFPGMRWDTRLRKWMWPNEKVDESTMQAPSQNTAALDALRRTLG